MLLIRHGCTSVHSPTMSSRAFIAHIDADCFYVSCERLRFAGLKGKAVGVLGNQGACVIAKSYELKAKGVRTGEPIWDAQKSCPEAIYVKRDFQWYEVISKQILEAVKQISTRVEYYSVDELFFDAQYLLEAKGPEGAKEFQMKILREIGIPVTIGISRSKLLAKLASDTAKPFGCVVATSEDECARLLQGKFVQEISGIAGRRAKTLEGYGIYTCEQFIKADRFLIRKLITKTGEDMWWELNGYSVLPINERRPAHKMVARGGSIGASTADSLQIEGWIIRNVERLSDALDHLGYFCDRLALMLAYKDGTGAYGSANLLGPTSAFEDLAGAARALYEAGHKHGRIVHYMHVIAEHLQFKDSAQCSLFMRTENRESIGSIARSVNAKHGRFTVRSAATLPLVGIYNDSANNYDICDIYGKTCF